MGKGGGAKQSESESESKKMWSCSKLSQRGVGGVGQCPDLRRVLGKAQTRSDGTCTSEQEDKRWRDETKIRRCCNRHSAQVGDLPSLVML